MLSCQANCSLAAAARTSVRRCRFWGESIRSPKWTKSAPTDARRSAAAHSPAGSSLPGPACPELYPFALSTVPNQTVIEPPSGWPIPDFRELWRYRDLLVLLTTRNIATRYRQSVLGFGWALVRPLVSMLIFTLIFGKAAGFENQIDYAYPVFAFLGLVPWMFFAALSHVKPVIAGVGWTGPNLNRIRLRRPFVNAPRQSTKRGGDISGRCPTLCQRMGDRRSRTGKASSGTVAFDS